MAVNIRLETYLSLEFWNNGEAWVFGWGPGRRTLGWGPYKWLPKGANPGDYEVMFDYTGDRSAITEVSHQPGVWVSLNANPSFGLMFPEGSEGVDPPEPGRHFISQNFMVRIRHKSNHIDQVSGLVNFNNDLTLAIKDNNTGSWAKTFSNDAYGQPGNCFITFLPDGFWHWSGNGTQSQSLVWANSIGVYPGMGANYEIRYINKKGFIASTNITESWQPLNVERYVKSMVGTPPIGEPDKVSFLEMEIEIRRKSNSEIVSRGTVKINNSSNR